MLYKNDQELFERIYDEDYEYFKEAEGFKVGIASLYRNKRMINLPDVARHFERRS